MSKNEEYTVMTPAQRAALAQQREMEAQMRKRGVPQTPQNNVPRQRPASQTATAARQRPATAQQRPVQSAGQRPAAPQNRRPQNAPVRKAPPQNMPNKEDTGEIPAYVRAGRGGYRPPKTKTRQVINQHRRRLDPRFKAALLALGAVLLVIIILLIAGVRYSTTRLDDGSKIRFFGISKGGEPTSGWLSYSTGERGKLKDGNYIKYSDGSIYEGAMTDGMLMPYNKVLEKAEKERNA